MLNGIDVSRWNGAINWTLIKNNGIIFAILKATGADDGYYTDRNFFTNLNDARSAGIQYLGAYHYAFFRNTSQALNESEHFKSVVNGLGLDWVVLDIEYPGASGDLTDACLAFLDNMAQTAKTIIYANPSFIRSHLNSRITRYPLWVANYGVSSPSVPLWPDWSIWQYSSTGRVSGASGYIDLNYMKDDFINNVEVEKVNVIVYKGDADLYFANVLAQKMGLGLYSEAALNNPVNAKAIDGVYCVGADISVPSGIRVIKSYSGKDRFETGRLVANDL